ncbi:MAG: hypothetical protein BWY27_00725 [Bacteroidetes bacterium ADurb.Bin234]|nr:MAG: hypothetical protein BWY27_00725 [Bacteroidetes bacterium ADurb.Bin234]
MIFIKRNINNLFTFLSTLLIIIIFLCQSCLINKESRERLRISKKSHITYKEGCQKFFYYGNNILLTANVDVIVDTVLFDTGFYTYISTIVFDDTNTTKKRKTQIKAINGTNTVFYDFFAQDVSCDLFQAVDCLGEIIYFSSDNYPSHIRHKLSRYKMVGLPLIQGYFNTLEINFSDSTLCVFEKGHYDTTDYLRIKSDFFITLKKVYLTINNIEYGFIFDTGFSGGLLMNKSEYQHHMDSTDILFEGIFAYGLNGPIISDTNILKCHKQNVYYTKSDSLIVNNLTFVENVDNNVMGIHFISQFDWIIDPFQEVVYVKPLTNKSRENIKKYEFTYKVDDYNDTLLIVCRSLSKQAIYPLFSIIQSVNGVKIIKDNIYYYKDLLNKPDAFKENNVVILPPQ